MPYRQAKSLQDASDLDVGIHSALGSPPSSSDSSPSSLSRQPDNSGDNFSYRSAARTTLYSPEERRRRDNSAWTIVQGVLAPVQFAIFLISLVLVLRYLATGEGFVLATVSVVVKTLALYAIMVTGSIWEKVVFGRYLFAPAFYWEDVFSILVLALHTGYLAALATGTLTAQEQMYLALAAYAAYVINATQFLLKLRAARLDRRSDDPQTSELLGQVP